MDRIEEALIHYLKDTYKCEIIILYGSYARGEATEESDLDVLCLCKNQAEQNDTSILEGKKLDVWVKNLDELAHPESYLHIVDGRLILDQAQRGAVFLEKVKEIYKKGPPPTPKGQKQFLIDWMKKMYIRSKKGDTEGHYRYHWLMKDFLEIYFQINDRWYEGPKKALKWLQVHDEDLYTLYADILRGENASEQMLRLIERLDKRVGD